MNRRHFLAALGATATLAPMRAMAGPDMTPYDPAIVEAALAEGRPVLLDFYATWCGTCRSQARILSRLRAENPAYDANILFVNVDWDTYKDTALRRDLNVPRRSTLVLLTAQGEVARLVASTREEDLRRILDLGLSAAG